MRECEEGDKKHKQKVMRCAAKFSLRGTRLQLHSCWTWNQTGSIYLCESWGYKHLHGANTQTAELYTPMVYCCIQAKCVARNKKYLFVQLTTKIKMQEELEVHSSRAKLHMAGLTEEASICQTVKYIKKHAVQWGFNKYKHHLATSEGWLWFIRRTKIQWRVFAGGFAGVDGEE